MVFRPKKKRKKISDVSEASTEHEEESESLALDPTSQASTPTDSSSNQISSQKPGKKPIFDPAQNHGRYAANDYQGCSHHFFAYGSLKPGDLCPLCAKAKLHGKLYALDPKVIVRLAGNPIISGACYRLERLRCALCGEIYQAQLPEAISHQDKYNETCRSAIAMSRYYMGMPFKRLETMQKLQEVPLADATQWDQMRILYRVISPVFGVLETLAAEGDLLHYDDTDHRILAAYGHPRAVHTTAFVSIKDSRAIHLFYTAQRCAGENFEALMEIRTTEAPLMTMTDALSHNMPKKRDEDLMARWIICFCLVHGRRKFYELFEVFKKESELVVEVISQVYKHEAECKKLGFNPEERLRYHQEHSAPLMEALRIWLNNQLLYDLVESNSVLGEAIRYMLKHFDAMTRFLQVAGAPIDNSLCERAIKIVIRHRRNSLFYKTFRGALIGDTIMSVIHTAARNDINPFDYLNELQRHVEEVKENPKEWLPWNYQETLCKIKVLKRAA